MKTQNVFFYVMFLATTYFGRAQEAKDNHVQDFQFSLLPPIGSNGQQSSQITNKFSLNLLAGHVGGVEVLEIGGVYNIVRNDVRSIQISGFGNQVDGEVHAVQMAGFSNINKGYTTGFQSAGFLNLISDSVRGFQMAGFTNITKKVSGFQIAGFNNLTSHVNGVQIAGFINTSGDIDGFQAAGFINKAKKVKGVQFSVINVADSVESGTPIGLVNVVRKNGFISFGLESDDVAPMQFAFRSGLDKFYTVLSIGTQPEDHWTYGAGFGSRIFLSETKVAFINPEFRWSSVHRNNLKGDENNHLVMFNLNAGYHFSDHWFVTAGPSLNFYTTNQLDASGKPKIDLAANPFMDNRTNQRRNQMWFGYSLGIGFKL